MNHRSFDFARFQSIQSEMAPTVKDALAQFRVRTRKILSQPTDPENPGAGDPSSADMVRAASDLHVQFRQSLAARFSSQTAGQLTASLLDDLRPRAAISLPVSEIQSLHFGRLALAAAVGATVGGLAGNPSLWTGELAIRPQDIQTTLGAVFGAGIGIVGAAAPLPLSLHEARGWLSAGLMLLARRAIFSAIAALIVLLVGAAIYAVFTGRGASLLVMTASLGTLIWVRMYVQQSGRTRSGTAVETAVEDCSRQFADAMAADIAIVACLATTSASAGEPNSPSALSMLQKVKESLLSHRSLGDRLEVNDVLLAVASIVDIDWPAGTDGTAPTGSQPDAKTAVPQRFQWLRGDHEAHYQPFGIVRDGNWVRVIRGPLAERGADGKVVVVKKGIVQNEE